MINSLLRRFGPSHWLKGWLLRFALASDLCKISDGKAQAMQPPWSCADAEPTRQWEASLPHISSSSWNHAMMLTFMQIQIRRKKVPFLLQDLGKKTPVRHSAISRFGMDSWHTFWSLIEPQTCIRQCLNGPGFEQACSLSYIEVDPMIAQAPREKREKSDCQAKIVLCSDCCVYVVCWPVFVSDYMPNWCSGAEVCLSLRCKSFWRNSAWHHHPKPSWDGKQSQKKSNHIIYHFQWYPLTVFLCLNINTL